MRLRLIRLTLVCKRATEEIDFDDISYFYGEIGAGKSSIAHLVQLLPWWNAARNACPPK